MTPVGRAPVAGIEASTQKLSEVDGSTVEGKGVGKETQNLPENIFYCG